MRSQLWLKPLAHALCLIPLATQLWAVYRQDLGPDPVALLTHHNGIWALRFLLLALLITPLRKVSGWNILIRYRRMLGLYGFFYACLHVSVYLVLDLQGFWTQVFEDIVLRPFITMGALAILCLIPLAATSTTWAMRKLGRKWQKLHRLAYLATGAAAVHFLWGIKSGKDFARQEPVIYLGIFVVLMLIRLGFWYRTKIAPKSTPPTKLQ